MENCEQERPWAARMRLLAKVSAVVMIVTAVTGGGAGLAAASTARHPLAEPANQPRFARFYQQKVSWAACGTAEMPLQCGRVRVPVDWSRPAGPAITLAVSRHQATGTRLGSLLLNPGGPGASGVDFVPAAAAGLDPNLVAAYDLVGWDPRGTGTSHPLTCPAAADTAFAAVDSSPDTRRERLAYEQAARTWAQACQRSSGPLFGHVDSLSTAKDMDVLRSVLGEAKLNYAGFSYGTLLGARYGDLFPGRVGRMVLDSPADPALDYEKWMQGNTGAKEDALNGYLTTCPDRSGCPFTAMTVMQARSWLLKLLKQADTTALTASNGEKVTQSMLYDAIYNLLITRPTWPDLDHVLAGLRTGNADAALAASGEKNTDPPITITNAGPLCLDLPDRRNAQQVMAQARRSERRNPVFARPTMAGVNTVCAQWPIPAVVHPHPVTAPGAGPILVVGITHDTAGPYRWARALAGELSTGRLLTYDGYGHGAVTVSSCARSTEAQFLISGLLPAAGTVCRT